MYYYGKHHDICQAKQTRKKLQSTVCSIYLLCLKTKEKLRVYTYMFLCLSEETVRTTRSYCSGIRGGGKWAEGGTGFSLYSILLFFFFTFEPCECITYGKIKVKIEYLKQCSRE